MICQHYFPFFSGNDGGNESTGVNVSSETESNPSVGSFVPLPGLREIPSQSSGPDLQRADIPVPIEIGQHGKMLRQNILFCNICLVLVFSNTQI